MTVSRFLRIGIAGYGVVGKRRRHYIDLHPRLQVVAVCDQRLENSRGGAGGCNTYSNYLDLLNDDLDALFVCLSNDVAAEVTIAGLDRGLHVFCEKPPGKNVDEVMEVKKVLENRPAQVLKYGFNHRYHESVKSALSIIKSKKLGEIVNIRGVYGKSDIVSFESDWRTKRRVAGGGILLDQGIHMVDLLRLFAGEFTEYHSVISNGYWGHDVEDNAYALMRTEDGTVALFHSSATLWRHSFSLDITLSEGAIILAGILSGSKSYGEETMTVINRSTSSKALPREETMRFNQDNSWQEEIEEFATAMASGCSISSGSIDDALNTMETVYKIYRADPIWSEKWGL